MTAASVRLSRPLIPPAAPVAPHVPRLPAPGRSRRIATYGVLAVMIALPGFALWAAITAYRTGIAVRHGHDLSNAFEAARYALAAEESLERKYRLEPGPEVRDNHRAAAADLAAALARARTIADPADAVLIGDVLADHAQYLDAIGRMFTAVDAHDTVAANAIDAADIDPRFDAIGAKVAAAAARHRALAAGNMDDLATIQTQVLVATPIVFALGFGLVVLFWQILIGLRRQMADSLVREADTVRTSEQRFRDLVQNASDLILICRSSGAIAYQSPAAERSWGFHPTELVGGPLLAFTHPDDQPALNELWNQVTQSTAGPPEDATRMTQLRLRDGAGHWRDTELIATNRLHNPAVHGIVVTLHDVTRHKAYERQLTQQAFFDALTGLPNRVLFLDRLRQALVRTSRRTHAVGLLFIDVDNFKVINDSLGHHVGDLLLTEAAARLQSCVRAQDTVARLGSDQFVVLLEGLPGAETAAITAQAIAAQFTRPFVLDSRDIVMTTSIGIALSEAGTDDADSLLRNADLALHRAKSDGRARHVVFDPSMHTDTLARLELETALRHAIDHHELRVHYQPLVTLASGRVSEVEALVRWQHLTRGLVPPAEFIPIAEATGLITPLGQWVLEYACRQVAEWHRQIPSDPPLMLSVNLSPRQFQTPTLAADVAETLRRTGLPAACLRLEITEGTIMHDVEDTIRTLWQLKGLGLQIAIDDFGTGYSSLAYLKRLPLDVLKIDRSFVSGIGQSPEDTAIVHAIMALAKSLHLKVTGEGIETAEQAALLGEWGCDHGQGYLFSRPLDDAATAAFLHRALAPASP